MESTWNPIWNTWITNRKDGKITNCAGDGRCAYTTRAELADAYARMLTEDQHNGQTYNLAGPAITQYELCGLNERGVRYGVALRTAEWGGVSSATY